MNNIEHRAEAIADSMMESELRWDNIEPELDTDLQLEALKGVKGVIAVVRGEVGENFEEFEERQLQIAGVTHRIMERIRAKRDNLPINAFGLARELATDSVAREEIAAIKDDETRALLLHHFAELVYGVVLSFDFDNDAIEKWGWYDREESELDVEVMELALNKLQARFLRIYNNSLTFQKDKNG